MQIYINVFLFLFTMKIIFAKDNEFKLIPESIEDLWHIYLFIEPKDIIEARSRRKIKKDDSKKVEIKTIFIKLEVEKKEFRKDSKEVKVLGKILESSEEIKGYHSIHIEIGKEYKIIKTQEVNQYILKKIFEKDNNNIMLGCLFDNHDAIIFEILNKRINILENVNIETNKSENLVRFEELFKVLNDYIMKKNYAKIILGYSVFWKNTIENILEKYSWREKIISVNINNPSINGIYELLKSSELESLLKDFRIKEETKILNEIFKRLKNNEKIEYGKKVYDLAQYGAIEILIISEDALNDEKNLALMKDVEKMNGKVIVIETDEVKKQINNLGKIIAFLRYNVE